MKKEIGITKLKVIIIFFILFLIIYTTIVVKNKEKTKTNPNIIKEANKVVYREEGLPMVTINVVDLQTDGNSEPTNSSYAPNPQSVDIESLDINKDIKNEIRVQGSKSSIKILK